MKTRLLPALTPEQAADLHQAFLDDLVPRLEQGRFDLRIAWALEPSDPMPPGPPDGFRQVGGDLGSRLFSGLASMGRDHEFVAAIGSDHPELDTQRVEEAFEALEEGQEVALGPASDGGYYLLAARASALDPSLFEGIEWSTGVVFDQTVARCRALGLEPVVLSPGHDVDSPADLERLKEFIACGDHGCPHTEGLLRSWGHLS